MIYNIIKYPERSTNSAILPEGFQESFEYKDVPFELSHTSLP